MAVRIIELIVVFYCLSLACSAVLGLQRIVLIYPTRTIYFLLRTGLLALTFGKLQLQPLAQNTKNRSKRQIRGFKGQLRQWWEERGEEEISAQQISWVSKDETSLTEHLEQDLPTDNLQKPATIEKEDCPLEKLDDNPPPVW